MAPITRSVHHLLRMLGLVPIFACGPGGPDFVVSLVETAQLDPAQFSPNLAEQLKSQPLSVAVEAVGWHGSSPALNERVRVVAHERLLRARAHEITPDVVPELMRLAEGEKLDLLSELAAAPASRSSLFSWIREGDGALAAYAAGAILETAPGFDEKAERAERQLAKKVLWDAYERERANMPPESYSRLTCTLSEVSHEYCPELKAVLVAAFEGFQSLFRQDLHAYVDSSCPSALEDTLRWARHPVADLAAVASAELLDRVAYRPQTVPPAQVAPVRAFLVDFAGTADARRRSTAAYGLTHYVVGANEHKIEAMLKLAMAEKDEDLLAALTAMSGGARAEFAAQLAGTEKPERFVNALIRAKQPSAWALATLRDWAAGVSTRVLSDAKLHYQHYFAVWALEKLFGQVFFPNEGGEQSIEYVCGNLAIEREEVMRDDLAAFGLPPPNVPEWQTVRVDLEADEREAPVLAERVARLQAARAAFIGYADAELARQ